MSELLGIDKIYSTLFYEAVEKVEVPDGQEVKIIDVKFSYKDDDFKNNKITCEIYYKLKPKTNDTTSNRNER